MHCASEHCGKLVFQINKYKFSTNNFINLLQTKPVESRKIVALNNRAPVSCANPSLIQFFQNHKDLFYFRVSEEKNHDKFMLIKYDMITDKMFEVSTHYTKAKYSHKHDDPINDYRAS